VAPRCGATGEGKIAQYIGNVSDAEKVPDEQPAKEAKSPLTGASAMKTHLTLVIGLALCAAAFWFELGRAEGATNSAGPTSLNGRCSLSSPYICGGNCSTRFHDQAST